MVYYYLFIVWEKPTIINCYKNKNNGLITYFCNTDKVISEYNIEFIPYKPYNAEFNYEKGILYIVGNLNIDIKVMIYGKNIAGKSNTYEIKLKNNDIELNWDSMGFSRGLNGYYLKKINFDKTCNEPYSSMSEGVLTEIIKDDKIINHKYIDHDEIWYGLTNEFLIEYGINWKGYLKIEESNKYLFKLSSYDGSWLYIDDELIINNKGNHEYISKENETKLEKGNHQISIYYMKNNGGSGIELLWRKENEEEYEELTNNYYYISPGILYYEYNYVTYILNETIPENKLIYLEEGEIKNCSINPKLPSGLLLNNENGLISGKSIETIIRTLYIIECDLSTNLKINTTLFITINENKISSNDNRDNKSDDDDDIKPEIIWLKENITLISGNIYENISLFLINGNNLKFEINRIIIIIILK